MISYNEIDFEDKYFIKYYDLLNSVFNKNKTKTVEYLKWEYLQNPIGKALGMNAFSNGELVAHFVAQPVNGIINNTPKKGLFALHVTTRPDFRGKGIFFEVNERTFLKAKELGYEFVIGIGNHLSTKVYQEKLHFKVIGKLAVKVGLGFPDILQDGSSSKIYSRVWSPDSLHWRLKNPNGKYYFIQKAGKTFILGETYFKGILAIMYQLDKGESFTLPKQVTKANSTHLTLWYGFNPVFRWSRKLFIDLPERFKPSPLNLIYRDLTDSGIDIYKENIVFNPIDHDAF